MPVRPDVAFTDPPSRHEERVEIRVRGRVQGVGFRPTVWRFARDLGLPGEVLNDAEGVLIRVAGPSAKIKALRRRVEREPPPLATIEGIETRPFAGALPEPFRIAETVRGVAHTQVSPDAAVCPACAAEVLDRSGRRQRYAFTTCTHCGPRLTIVEGIPYDRQRTTMARFPLCEACLDEYSDPADRRFHAEAIACPACGPQLDLVRLDGARLDRDHCQDAVAAAAHLIGQGEIVAMKGLGGYQLACVATDDAAVLRLRRLKMRDAKPFALMARDRAVVERYCKVSPEEMRELESPRAPIVLLPVSRRHCLPDAVAPGLATLGFMLPTTPLHMLLVENFEVPLVMTSGNVSGAPQVTGDAEARDVLASIVRYGLVHDRQIANRLDDSVVRMMAGRPRVLRRARGFAPAPIRLPESLAAAPEILATGGELKSTFCLLKDGEAILSQHQGDLEDVTTWVDYRKNLDLYRGLFDHRPQILAADCHPDYLSSKFAREMATDNDLPLIEVQHHHAHVAACLAENGRGADAPPVLGIVLDGLGWGDDGTIWGGEFLLAGYLGYRRLGCLQPVAMPGGARAVHEPWRNLYAHIEAAMGGGAFRREFGRLNCATALDRKACGILEKMIRGGINSPLASSCGRLFDAVAAALGVCFERQEYEGEAGARLEALAAEAAGAAGPDRAYPFKIEESEGGAPLKLQPAPMWRALFEDLEAGVPRAVVARRFHAGLARAIADTAVSLASARRRAGAPQPDTVVLSGGCFQNRLLFEGVAGALRTAGFDVLSNAEVPANDGGLALGQAAIAAARVLFGGTIDPGDVPHVSALPVS